MNAAAIPIYVAVIAGLFGLISFLFTKFIERQSVTKALLAEIQRLLVVIREHHSHWTRWMENKETQKHPLIPFSSDVYSKNIDNVGLVNHKYVGLIVQFYGYLKFVNSLQKTQAKDIELHGGSSESFDHIYQASLARMIKDFDNAFGKAFKHYHLQ
jgi:hypothetical protein